MQSEQIAVERYKANQMRKAAGSWFWWIGALSVVNSFLAMSGKRFTFTFGLGISQIGDMWLADKSPIVSTIGLFLSFGCPALLFLLAWLTQHTSVALTVGVVLYSLDTLVFVVAKDWLSVGFHVFALFLILSAWRAYRKAMASLPPENVLAPAQAGETVSAR